MSTREELHHLIDSLPDGEVAEVKEIVQAVRQQKRVAEAEAGGAGVRPIEEIAAELAAKVPQEEWDRLPADLSDNLDHYLYGTPKK